MQNTSENIQMLKDQLKPCACGCGHMEKLDCVIEGDKVVFASAYTDWHVRVPGDFSRGNYCRMLKTSGSLTAAIG